METYKIVIELSKDSDNGIQAVKITPDPELNHMEVIGLLFSAIQSQDNLSHKTANDKMIDVHFGKK